MKFQKVTIVFDSPYERYLNNRIFLDSDIYDNTPGASWLRIFYEKAKERDWEVLTADLFMESKIKCNNAYLISEVITQRTHHLLANGVVPLILLSGESPNVDLRFFAKIKRNTGLFKNVLLFAGTGLFSDPISKFHNFYWPNDLRNTRYFNTEQWQSRKLLAMVASNKQRIEANREKNFISLQLLKRRILWIGLKVVYPVFRFRDLYALRLEALDTFSKSDNIDLFGKGWENLSGLSNRQKLTIAKLNPVPVDDKYLTLNQYKFSLCFENCIFPGYITEKIFDSMFAGTIPVYYGAPDITDFVPAACFIDFRKFKDLNQLEDYILHISETDTDNYLSAISDYLVKQKLRQFTDYSFADKVLEIVNSECSE